MRELTADTAPTEPASWSAVLPALASLFPAGLPRGELVEITGRRSAGRFGLALSLLAAATDAGESAALVDLGDALDPQQAVLCGVELTRLLWARPRSSQQALAAAEALVGGGFPLVVVDLADSHWLRLARAAQEARTLVVVSAPYRVGGVAAGVALDLGRPRMRWLGSGREPRLLAGVEARLEAVKPHRTACAGPPQPALRLAAS
jgi:hypothetical protein